MANKKKNSPADDLINQLLDDVNNIDTMTTSGSEPEESNPFLTAQREKVDTLGIGIAPNRELDDNTRNGDIAIWESVEDELSNEATGGSSPFGEVDSQATNISLPKIQPQLVQDLPQPEIPQVGKFVDQNDEDSVSEFQVPQSSRAPSEEEEKYQGPSIESGYQSPDEIFNNQEPASENEPTVALGEAGNKRSEYPFESSEGGGFSIAAGGAAAGGEDNEKTIAANGFASRGPLKRVAPQEKVVIGSLKGNRSGNVLTAVDASLAQAESLKIAQQRILELEKENDRLRQENEELGSAGEIIRHRSDEISSKIQSLEREKEEAYESYQSELMILKGNLAYKESEAAKARLKIEELEHRLKADFKKIRVRERELENRLELARAEKSALVRAKDDNILDLKRKVDQLQGEIDNYRDKCLDLNRTIESNQEQFKRTVRALKLALTNLEVKDENIVPLKKAE